MDKSYPSLFELLWYSQLPCFDVVNITTTNEDDEYGKRAQHSFAFIINCLSDFVTIAFCALLLFVTVLPLPDSTAILQIGFCDF